MDIVDKKEQPAGCDNEKNEINYDTGVLEDIPYEKELEENEVFKKNVDGVDFRTVGWPRASVIFLKSTCISGSQFSKPSGSEVFQLTNISSLQLSLQLEFLVSRVLCIR